MDEGQAYCSRFVAVGNAKGPVVPRAHLSDPHLRPVLALCALWMGIAFLAVCATYASGEGPPADYEWKLPIYGPVCINGQDLDGLLTDPVTGGTYEVSSHMTSVSQTVAEWEVNCYRFEPSTITLRPFASYNYTGAPAHIRFDCVHDGRWYHGFVTGDSILHLRIDNATEDEARVSLSSRSVGLVSLGFHDGKLLFALTDYGQSYVDNDLYSFDPSVHVFSHVPLFDLSSSMYDALFSVRGDTIYCLETRWDSGNSGLTVQAHSLDLRNMVRTGPVYLYSLPANAGSPRGFLVDSTGDTHILGWDGTMERYSRDGALLGRTRIDESGKAPGTSWDALGFAINGSDCIYLVGRVRASDPDVQRMTCTVVSREYEPLWENQTIATDEHMGLKACIAANGTDRMFIAFSAVIDDHLRVALCWQIEPTPDLAVRPGTLAVEEVPGADKPIHVAIVVDNVGRAACREFSVRVSRRGPGEVTFLTADLVHVGTALAPGASLAFADDLRLPRGYCLLKVAVEGVVPYEDARNNNAVEVWVFLKVNNPPVVTVESPVDGAVVDGSLELRGRTLDIDAMDNVTTTVTGLPGAEARFEGTGEWSLPVSLVGIGSGDYELTFQATDGMDPSRPVTVRVRVDHADESIVLGRAEPDGDVTLLVGTDLVFRFDASDRFGRPVTFSWSLDGQTAGSNVSYLYFRAERPGRSGLEAAASNGLTRAVRYWNVTVRDPIAPDLSAAFPVGPVRVNKHDVVDFSVEVVNPDLVPFSTSWYLDGAFYTPGGTTSASVRFDASGTHSLEVLLVSLDEVGSHSWVVEVINRPPTVTDRSPSASVVTLGPSKKVDFSVVPSDPDGDALTFAWRVTNASVAASDGPSASYELSIGRSYEVTLTVSDGENATEVTWWVDGGTAVADRASAWWAPFAVVALVAIALCGLLAIRRVRGGRGRVGGRGS